MMEGKHGARCGRLSTKEKVIDHVIARVGGRVAFVANRDPAQSNAQHCKEIASSRRPLLARTLILYNWQMSTLSPAAQKIQDLLNSLGYHYTVIEHAESTRTAQEAADRAGCELGQIVKSLIFKGNDSGKPILVLTSGVNRVDEKRIQEYAGESISRPNADFVRAVTGFAIGGVPPVGHIQKMETYIDEDFLQYQTVWSAAGTPNAIFELKTEDLQKMTNGQVARVK
jgi:prolyl-tRNA editing enzyme YbaK/EbsC (Cys-tRNA(Pro) deacylase)